MQMVPKNRMRTRMDPFQDHRALVEFLVRISKDVVTGDSAQSAPKFKPKRCAYCNSTVTEESALNCIASSAKVRGITEHISPMCKCAVAHLLDDEEQWAHTCQICQGKAILVSSVFVDKHRKNLYQVIPGVILYSMEHNRASVYIRIDDSTGEWVDPSAIEVALHKGTNNKWKTLCYVATPDGKKLVRFCDVPSWEPIGKGKVDLRCAREIELALNVCFEGL
jgi:hypothetical protein